MEKDTSSERKIILAAREVFIRKGYHGARMQEIADEAGINKASLHYYFRSKDRLFEEIFKEAFSKFLPVLSMILLSEESLETKISSIVLQYTQLLSENPYLPQFILSETARDPDGLNNLFLLAGFDPAQYVPQFTRQLAHYIPVNQDPRHLLVNTLSMCIFPYAARPLLERTLFGGDTTAYDNFLQERKTVIPDALIQGLPNHKNANDQ